MRRILLPALLLMIGAVAVVAWLWQDMERQLNQPLRITEQEVLHVPPGTNLRTLSMELQRRGWMQRPVYFEIEARRTDRARQIKAGEYAIPPGTTPQSLLDLLVSGQVIQRQMTIIEGWSFRELLQAVMDSPLLRRTLSGSEQQIMAQIGCSADVPEGAFLPDTYRFPNGTTDVEFLRRACAAMDKVLSEEWAGRAQDLPYTDPYQALIMASVVEKETGVPEERSRIAGVFVRRLKLGMRLQTDPTVIYALGENFNGNLRRDHLELDSPFNTYLYAGLPPTPIAMPGRAAIHAALHPAEDNALYFVARGDGTHEFSATLEEHNRAVRKYQLGKE